MYSMWKKILVTWGAGVKKSAQNRKVTIGAKGNIIVVFL